MPGAGLLSLYTNLWLLYQIRRPFAILPESKKPKKKSGSPTNQKLTETFFQCTMTGIEYRIFSGLNSLI
jgi:hypothetical protein